MRRPIFTQQPTPFDLHAAAQEAERCGMYELAAQLFREAADCAISPAGAKVLLEKAAAADERRANLARAGRL